MQIVTAGADCAGCAGCAAQHWRCSSRDNSKHIRTAGSMTWQCAQKEEPKTLWAPLLGKRLIVLSIQRQQSQRLQAPVH